MQEEELGQEELPCFGSNKGDTIKFVDPFEDEHNEITDLLGKIDGGSKGEGQVMMSNDDSFSNFIAPAGEIDSDEKL